MKITNNKATKKYLTLDAIRGIAAIFVLTRHGGDIFPPDIFFHSYLAVDIFFVMSGFVIANAYNAKLTAGSLNFTSFLNIRLIRLYPLYIFSLVLSIALFLTSKTASNPNFQWVNFLIVALLSAMILPSQYSSPGNALFPLNGPSWSIFFELFANGIYAKLYRFISLKNLAVLLLLSAVGLILCTFKKGNMDFGFNWKNGIGGFPRVIYSFSAGLLIYHLNKQSISHPIKHSNSSILSLAIVIFACLILSLPQIEFDAQLDLLITFFAIPAVVYIATRTEPEDRYFLPLLYTKLGEASYAIYILQIPFFVILNRLGILEETNSFAAAIISILLLINISLFLDKIYDTPIRIFLSQRITAQMNKVLK